MSGAFLTSREIFDNPIWEDVTKFRIFFYIYGKAVFSEDGARVGGLKLERGQYLRSYRNLRDDLEYRENRSIKKYSLSTISKKINELVEEKRLKIEDTELGTLFTVLNYAEYQGFDRYKNDNENAERTQREQSANAERTERERSANNNNKGIKDIKAIKESTTTTTSENPFRIFESEGFGTISPIMADRINDFIDSYGERWVCEALKESAYHGKRNLPYVKAILDRWRTSGIDEPWTVEKQPSNVKPFNRSRSRPNKPQPIMHMPDDVEMTDEEMLELQKIVKELDGG